MKRALLDEPAERGVKHIKTMTDVVQWTVYVKSQGGSGPNFSVTLNQTEIPTMLDVRREIIRKQRWSEKSIRFDLVPEGMPYYGWPKCHDPLPFRMQTVTVGLRHRFGGNPCGVVMDSKHECQLFIKQDSTGPGKEWVIGPRGHLSYCACPDRFLYPTLISLNKRMWFEWHVEQECYCLCEDTFNSDNITVWRVDEAAKPFQVKSVKLQIKLSQTSYDHPSVDGSKTDNTCVVSIRAPVHGWEFGLYELRFNQPESPLNKFHITGFNGQRKAQTLYSDSLTLRFFISPGTCADLQNRLHTTLSTLPHDLFPLILDFLFPPNWELLFPPNWELV